MNGWIAGALSLLAAAVIGVVFFWPEAPQGIVPIEYGVDACAECRMVLTRPGFAAELRAADGTLRKFDDVGCLLTAMVRERAAMPEAWVEDHDGGGFVSLLGATLVHVKDGDTPMGHGLLAFADAAAARRYAAERGGAIVALEALVRDPNALARADVPASGKPGKP